MSQTTYARNFEVSREGAIADRAVRDVVSRVSDAVVPFGKFLSQDFANDNKAALPALATDVTNAKKALGVAVAEQSMENSLSGDPSYPIKHPISVLKKGRVYVKVEENVTPNSDVFVRYAAGGNGLGSFGATAGTTERAQLAGARYLSTAAAGELAVLELDL